MSALKSTFITKEQLPLVIEPEDSNITPLEFSKLLKEERAFLKEKLLQHGGLLFRNFPIKDHVDFANFIQQLNFGDFINYIGGDSPRKKICEGVYTSTEAPPYIKISLHNELSYLKTYPAHIYFYCETPPETGGETIIADARKVFQSIDNEVKNRFIEKQLRYVSCYYYKSDFMQFINRYHKSWIDVFETEDKSEVERKCIENDVKFEWNHNDWIKISQTRPATLKHPITDESVWFNQAHLYDLNPKLLGLWPYLGMKLLYLRKNTKLHEVFFADNTIIPQEDLYHILNVLDQNTTSFPWQKGDVMVLDNILSMHGRSTFTGKRRVLAAMTN